VAVSPAYTFGAPAVFCEGDCASADSCRLPGTDGNVVRTSHNPTWKPCAASRPHDHCPRL